MHVPTNKVHATPTHVLCLPKKYMQCTCNSNARTLPTNKVHATPMHVYSSYRGLDVHALEPRTEASYFPLTPCCDTTLSTRTPNATSSLYYRTWQSQDCLMRLRGARPQEGTVEERHERRKLISSQADVLVDRGLHVRTRVRAAGAPHYLPMHSRRVSRRRHRRPPRPCTCSSPRVSI